jgi:hypothetical protein
MLISELLENQQQSFLSDIDKDEVIESIFRDITSAPDTLIWRELTRTYQRETGNTPYDALRFSELVRYDDDFVAWLKNDLMYEIDRSISTITSQMQGTRIPIWRAIYAPENKKPSLQGDRYWAWSKSSATPHWGNKKQGDVRWLFSATVDVRNIDWQETLIQNSNPEFSEEREITVQGPVKLINIEKAA